MFFGNSVRWFIAVSIIYSISIFTTIIPSYFDQPILIADIALSISLTMSIFMQPRLTVKIDRSSIVLLLLILSLVICMYFFYHLLKNGINTTAIGYVVYMLLLSLLLCLVHIDIIEKTVRLYVYISILISTFGVIAWISFTSGIIDHSDYLFSAYHYSGGKIQRETLLTIDKHDLQGYNAPFYFGLITTGNDPMSIYGFEFYRGSGWSQEPTIASLFIMPAFLILLFDRNIFSSRILNNYSFFIVMAFYMTVFAVGSIVAILFLFSIYLIINKDKLVIKLRNIISLILGSMLFGYAIIVSSPPVYKRLFETSDDSTALSGSMSLVVKQLMWWADNEPYFWFVRLLVILIIALSVFIAIYKINFCNNKNAYGYYLPVLYYCLHGLKGNWTHILVYGFFLFLVILMFRARSLVIYNYFLQLRQRKY